MIGCDGDEEAGGDLLAGPPMILLGGAAVQRPEPGPMPISPGDLWWGALAG